MKIGQPELSEGETQRSGLFVAPAKSEDRSTSITDDLRLKEGIRNRGWIVSHWT